MFQLTMFCIVSVGSRRIKLNLLSEDISHCQRRQYSKHPAGCLVSDLNDRLLKVK